MIKKKVFNMDIYLIRHGIAADPSEYECDRDRPLTAKGRKKKRTNRPKNQGDRRKIRYY